MDQTDGHDSNGIGSPDGDEWDQIYEELAGSSDRAVAVLAQAMLEQDVRWLVGAAMRDGKHTKHLIGSCDSPGVLTFSDQCRLAHSLHLFGDDVLSDLLTIAKIRNRFGHSRSPLTFESPSIRDRCLSLRNHRVCSSAEPSLLRGTTGRESARGRYVLCVESILNEIAFNFSYRAEAMKATSLSPIAPAGQDHSGMERSE